MASPITERAVIIDVLELYKDLPCLWDNSCTLYHDRYARQDALKVLLSKYRVLEKNATIRTIRNKIDNWRTAYRREYRKVQKSLGAGADIYVPKLWYYEYFAFLGDKDNINKTTDHTVEDNEDEEESGTQNSLRSPVAKRRYTNFMMLNEEKLIKSLKYDQSDEENPLESEQNALSEEEEVLVERPQKALSDKENPAAEAYGYSVGLQLKEMNKLQRFIAEKLIADVIFNGKMNNLTTESSIQLKH